MMRSKEELTPIRKTLSSVSDEQLLDSFNASQSKNEIAEVLKELFDEGKIYLIGDLEKDEIRLLTRMYMISRIKNIPIWEEGISFYCKLMLSKDRKSRKELIEAIKGIKTEPSFLQRINPFR